MNAPTAVTLFSGGGLAALGARTAGFDLVGAVEYAEDIAGVYADNLGPCVTVGKVEDVNPLPYIGIDALLASPVCTRMSVANANRGETEVDRVAAEGVCRWLRVCRPKAFVMENVTQYRDSDSYRLIMATLYRLGYLCTDDTCNAADYGVPQTRRRMIVRALLGQMPPPLKPTHYNPLAASEDGGLFAEDTRGMTPWVGWYAAIEDILHTLPESKFADWQLKRLDPQLLNMASQKLGSFYADTTTPRETGITCRAASEPVPSITASAFRRNVNIPRALLIEGDAAGDRPPTCGTSAEPAFTLKATGSKHVHRAFLCGVQGEGGDLYREDKTPSPTVTTAHNVAKYRAFLTDGFNAGRDATVLAPERPAMTVHAGAMRRPASTAQAWLEQGHIVSMTPRALARFMSCPDTYRLPESKKLASTVLGNGLPCLLAQRIMEQLKEYIQ